MEKEETKHNMALHCILALVAVISAFFYFWVLKNNGDDE